MYGKNMRKTWVGNDWTVYVIDMSKFDVCAAYNIDSHNETQAIFTFQDRGNGGSVIDFAYFAVCDTWEEIKTIVDDEQIVYTSYGDNNVTLSNLADYND
jgi:hypothetical protein